MSRVRSLARRFRARLSAGESPDGAGPDDADAPSGPHCIVCSARAIERRHLVFKRNPSLVKDATVCRRCGYVAIDELVTDRYRGKTSLDQLPAVVSRAGTLESAGREFHMAQLGMAIRGGRRRHDVLVYGTTLRRPHPLASQRYLFYPDHTSLYTPRSLQLIAAANDLQVDFRPVHGIAHKRYVIFTRTPAMMRRVVAHFASHPLGPSEKSAPEAPSTPA